MISLYGDLEGEIPVELAELEELDKLDLSRNLLQGESGLDSTGIVRGFPDKIGVVNGYF